jgi:hypothetical protein
MPGANNTTVPAGFVFDARLISEDFAHIIGVMLVLTLREETLALRKAKLGPDHPDTLRSMNGLASSHAALGRHAEALKLRAETLALRKAKLGPDHPETLLSMSNLAESLVALHRPSEAVAIIDECLRRAETDVFGTRFAIIWCLEGSSPRASSR